MSRQAKQAHWNVKDRTLSPSTSSSVKWLRLPKNLPICSPKGRRLSVVLPRVGFTEFLTPALPGRDRSEREHVDALSTALATFGKAAREAIEEAERLGDTDTADVFTEISRETDKQLWLIEAHLYS